MFYLGVLIICIALANIFSASVGFLALGIIIVIMSMLSAFAKISDKDGNRNE